MLVMMWFFLMVMMMNVLLQIETSIAFIVMSYLVAIPVWLLVDAPLTEFLQKLLNGKFCHKDKKVISENDIALRNNFKLIESEEGNAMNGRGL